MKKNEITKILSKQSNVYLIKTANHNIFVDTGTKNHPQRLQNKFASLGIDHLDWLFITHTHFDHCWNAAFLKEKYGCRIAVSEKAKKHIQTV